MKITAILLALLAFTAVRPSYTESVKGVYYPNVAELDQEDDEQTDTALAALVRPQSAYDGF